MAAQLFPGDNQGVTVDGFYDNALAELGYGQPIAAPIMRDLASKMKI